MTESGEYFKGYCQSLKPSSLILLPPVATATLVAGQREKENCRLQLQFPLLLDLSIGFKVTLSSTLRDEHRSDSNESEVERVRRRVGDEVIIRLHTTSLPTLQQSGEYSSYIRRRFTANCKNKKSPNPHLNPLPNRGPHLSAWQRWGEVGEEEMQEGIFCSLFYANRRSNTSFLFLTTPKATVMAQAKAIAAVVFAPVLGAMKVPLT
jgi:hypothetical protein